MKPIKIESSLMKEQQQTSRPTTQSQARQLYAKLTDKKYAARPFEKSTLGENMELIKEVICQYWKPRFILDHAAQTAFEFMSYNEKLLTVRPSDIMWKTLEGMKGRPRAEALTAHYPTQVSSFKNGVAEVSWQINPDGMYFMDSSGFGMTDDDEETLYGYIDKQGRVVAKFRAISDFAELKEMEREAIENLNKNKNV